MFHLQKRLRGATMLSKFSRGTFALVVTTSIAIAFIMLVYQPLYVLPAIPAGLHVDLHRDDMKIQNLSRASSGAKTLRILTLGASIMSGSLTLDQNGFRKVLRDKLVSDGFKVNMVGNRIGGNMSDNQVTGWGGFRIDQVAAKAELSYSYMPNVILLQCGSNDYFQNFAINQTSKRYEALIDRIHAAVPGSLVVAGTMLPNDNARYAAEFVKFNVQVKAMVANKTASGLKIALADFSSSEYSVADLRADGTHPSDEGYAKMGKTFYNVIMKAQDMITDPISEGVPDYDKHPITSCTQVIDTKQKVVQVQESSPAISDDGNYTYSSISKGEIRSLQALGATADQISAKMVGDNVFWADINGDGLDDYVYLSDTGSFHVALNNGDGNFDDLETIEFEGSCLSAHARFEDINADGRDDFFCISPTGQLTCWLNVLGAGQNIPTWKSLGIVKAAVPGYKESDIRLGDIDGDGRVDYIALNRSGDIFAWRNVGFEDAPTSWQAMGVIKASKVGLLPDAQYDVRFIDINGDGRDDLLSIDNVGHVYTLINQRGRASGFAPSWIDVGLTHNYTNLAITNNTEVKFGRVWGSNSTTDYNKADYTIVTAAGNISTWQNTGHGGTRLKGDGVRYCDMFGSKSDDFIWMDYDGSLTLFGNIHNPPSWKEYGKIHDGGVAPRGRVHLADIDGDGLCDYVVVSENNASDMKWMRNGGFNETFQWGTLQNAYKTKTVSPSCEWGIEGVQFADITGYGYPDYLCISPNGTVHAWRNEGGFRWTDVGIVKTSEGYDRNDIRFADMNGNGRADYLALSPSTGILTAFTNANNSINPSTPGSTAHQTYKFTARGIFMASVGVRASSIAFANLGGYQRADALIIDPRTADASVFSNVCPDVEVAVASSTAARGVSIERITMGREMGGGWWMVGVVLMAMASLGLAL